MGFRGELKKHLNPPKKWENVGFCSQKWENVGKCGVRMELTKALSKIYGDSRSLEVDG
jgi:hypothetical protein